MFFQCEWRTLQEMPANEPQLLVWHIYIVKHNKHHAVAYKWVRRSDQDIITVYPKKSVDEFRRQTVELFNDLKVFLSGYWMIRTI